MDATGVSDDELARRVKSDRTTISRIRREKHRPSWELAERLKDVTGGNVTPNDFVSSAA